MEGKVVAITGGASGIGLATAKILASRGAKLSIADVSEKNLEKARTEIKEHAPNSGDVLTTPVDVRHSSQIKDWLKQTVDKFGKLDGAVNAAGVIAKNQANYALDEEDEEQWDFVLAVNLTGVMLCMKAELNLMKSGASIVNVASIAGLTGMPKSTAYTVSKHGVVGLTKCAAVDFGSKGVRINAVAPGFIFTPLTLQAQAVTSNEAYEKPAAAQPLGRFAEPNEVGKVIAFLLSDDASFVHGAIYTADGGLMAKGHGV